jgi:flagellar hook-length control protein FliK
VLRQVADTPSLQLSVFPQTSRMTLDVGAAGSLAMQMHVKDGVADLQVSGSAASLVDQRSADLRLGLNSQGIALGRLEVATDNAGATGANADAQGEREASYQQSRDQGEGTGKEETPDEQRAAAQQLPNQRPGIQFKI